MKSPTQKKIKFRFITQSQSSWPFDLSCSLHRQITIIFFPTWDDKIMTFAKIHYFLKYIYIYKLLWTSFCDRQQHLRKQYDNKIITITINLKSKISSNYSMYLLSMRHWQTKTKTKTKNWAKEELVLSLHTCVQPVDADSNRKWRQRCNRRRQRRRR